MVRCGIRILLSAGLIAGTAAAQTRSGGRGTTANVRIPVGRQGTAAVAPTLADTAVVEYVLQIVAGLAHHAGVQPPVKLTVIKDAGAYAETPDRGKVVLTTGLIQRAASEAELAGVVAHILGHGGTPCILSNRIVSGIGLEQESNRRAVEYLKVAGYDPLEMLAFFTKLRFDLPRVAEALPADELLSLRSELEQAPPPAKGYVLTTSAFESVRSTLAGGEVRRTNQSGGTLVRR